jgi:IS5 family transposase
VITTPLSNLKPYPLSKDKYKVKNWSSYNEGLKNRGSLTVWVEAGLASQWKGEQGGRAKRGGQRQYSNLAIEACLVLRKVYHLPLRQTEGFIKSIFAMGGILIPVPDYTTLCRRSNGLKVNLSRVPKGEVTDIVVDSTGLKVYGEGEWKVRKHGAGKHRTWMKLHIAANSESQQIEAVTLTTNAVTDATEVDALLRQIDRPVRNFYGDGAYDKDKVRKPLCKKGIKQIIPPQRNAVPDKRKREHRAERDAAIAAIKEQGREAWKEQQGYHQRSKAETVMFRYKTIIGGNLAARKTEHQKAEVEIGCKILNIMLQLTKPQSGKVA